MRRVGLIEFYDGDQPPWREPIWLDIVLYDIPQTVLLAVRAAYSSGARAVTLIEPMTRIRKYADVMRECEALNIGVYVVALDDPECVRYLFRACR